MGATRSRRCNSRIAGQWMTISESSEGLPAPLVVTATPVPSVMMAAASAPTMVMTAPAAVTMTVATPVLDLDEVAVLWGQGRHGQSGGSGYGHGK